MKTIKSILITGALAFVLSGGAATAQDAGGGDPDMSSSLPDLPDVDASSATYLPQISSRYRIMRRVVVAEDGAVEAPHDPSEVIITRTDGVELEIERMGVASRFQIVSRDPVAVWTARGKPEMTGAYRGIRLMADGAVEQVTVTEGTLMMVTAGSAIQTVTTVFADRINDEQTLNTPTWTSN